MIDRGPNEVGFEVLLANCLEREGVERLGLNGSMEPLGRRNRQGNGGLFRGRPSVLDVFRMDV